MFCSPIVGRDHTGGAESISLMLEKEVYPVTRHDGKPSQDSQPEGVLQVKCKVTRDQNDSPRQHPR